MATTPTRAPFVFTGHDGKMLCGFERNPLRRAAFCAVVHRCDAAVALSYAEARFLQRYARPPRVEVVPNGIPAREYESIDPLGPPGRSGLIFAGQLIPLKGVDTLLRAMKVLEDRPALKLTLAYHNRELESDLKALATKLGIAARVCFAGPQTPEQLGLLNRKAEVFVLPSHAESLPSVITEALLAGTPVISTRIGGIPEQVSGFGRLVSPGDPAELAAAIAEVLDNPPTPDVRLAMRAYARARFSTVAMVEGHLRVYRSVTNTGATGRRGGHIDGLLRVAVAAYWSRAKARPGCNANEAQR